MESVSNVEVRNVESLIWTTGTMSASSDEISLAFSSWDEISNDVPTDYVSSEIYGKYKIPVIVITPPEEGPHYSDGIVFSIESYVTCFSELTPSSDASEDTTVAPVQDKCDSKKPIWKRLRSLFTCCCPWKKCGRKDQVES